MFCVCLFQFAFDVFVNYMCTKYEADAEAWNGFVTLIMNIFRSGMHLLEEEERWRDVTMKLYGMGMQ